MFNFALAKKVDSSTSEVDEQYHFLGNAFDARFLILHLRQEGLDPGLPFFFFNTVQSFFPFIFCVIEKKALPLSPINGHNRHRSKIDA